MVFCTNCGKENEDGSKFCFYCGKKFSLAEYVKGKRTERMEVFESDKPNLKTQEHKSPWAAGLLNLIIAGLGLVYVKEYAKAVIGFVLVLLVGWFGGLIFGLIALVFVMAWSSDEARKYNRKIDEYL